MSDTTATRETFQQTAGELAREHTLLEELIPSCPAWCNSEHHRAVDEGVTAEAAAVHSTADLVGRLEELRNSVTGQVVREGRSAGWDLILQAPGDKRCWGTPAVNLDVYDGHKTRQHIVLNMTGGEARVLARQLLHFADLLDLSS
ncbi:hypothetical protein SAMN04488570_1365 [Nocardioides scoriae]|uniref:Uncharacterized protein n=1 Tax=Nocardioides scoriae TaxID=642780 RepID=A0A1H1QAT1_9ACTN|nr:hypothetical protein [Nocardioides scoriae]SDS20621.1 hypothetical protein SAMN04488570_1365 [Nocardioides scoriae]